LVSSQEDEGAKAIKRPTTTREISDVVKASVFVMARN